MRDFAGLIKKQYHHHVLQEERHAFILEQLRLHKKVHVSELTGQLDVSADTIRRDLIELEKEGKLLRVHGGAIAVDFHTPFQPREVYAQKEKIQIAKKALDLISDGMTLLMGGGTIMLELARMLPENLKGTLFTVSPLVALEATQRSSVEVILLAGRLSRNSYICTGATVISQLSELTADLCLMGTNGISFTGGITDYDWEVVQVKKAMLRSADKTALLCLSEKIGVIHKLRVCPFHRIHFLVTERQSEEKKLSKYAGYCKVI